MQQTPLQINAAPSLARPADAALPKPSRWLSPLFYWEMRRESRKGNSYLPRVVYAGGMLLLLYLVMGNAELSPTRLAKLCNEAFICYIVLQYMAVALLTPAYLAGAIIEDRQQRTLSLLLTTHLTPREIVVGKMLGRLVPMLGVLLAGVPVLAILQLLGGISMGWLAFHTVMALALMLTIGMHGIRASATCKTVGGAMMVTYAFEFVVGFLGLPFGLLFLGSNNPVGLVIGACVVVGFYFFIAWISLQNAIALIGKRDQDHDMPVSEYEMTEQEPVRSAQTIEKQKSPAEERTDNTLRRGQSEPSRKTARLKSWPVLWKEMYFPSPDLVVVLTVLLCGFPPLMYLSSQSAFRHADADTQLFIIECAKLFLALLLMLTTVRAAGTMILERKKQTLVSLLTTPLSWDRVIAEFWLGSFWRYRWMALGTLVIVLCASMLQPLSLFVLAPTYLTQLGFFSMLGIACSMVFQSTFQARVIVSVFFFFSYFVFARVNLFSTMPYTWFLDYVLCPYRAWSMSPTVTIPRHWITLEQFTIQSPWKVGLLYFVNLGIVWTAVYLLFQFSRHRLKVWLGRSQG